MTRRSNRRFIPAALFVGLFGLSTTGSSQQTAAKPETKLFPHFAVLRHFGPDEVQVGIVGMPEVEFAQPAGPNVANRNGPSRPSSMELNVKENHDEQEKLSIATIDDCVANGDVSRAIHNNIKWIEHFHTAGVPGRYQLDDDQELNYRYIAKVIAELNYTGYVGHEYNPTQGADPTACLKQAFEIFDV